MLCRWSPVPFRPTTSPYPIKELARTPSIPAMSSKRTVLGTAGVGAVAPPARRAVNRRMQEAVRIISKPKQFEEEIRDRIRRPCIIADHAFSKEFDFKVAERARQHGVIGGDILGPHQPAQNCRLLLIVHADAAPRFDHHQAVEKTGDNLARKIGA